MSLCHVFASYFLINISSFFVHLMYFLEHHNPTSFIFKKSTQGNFPSSSLPPSHLNLSLISNRLLGECVYILQRNTKSLNQIYIRFDIKKKLDVGWNILQHIVHLECTLLGESHYIYGSLQSYTRDNSSKIFISHGSKHTHIYYSLHS